MAVKKDKKIDLKGTVKAYEKSKNALNDPVIELS